MIHYFDFAGYTTYIKGLTIESIVISPPTPRKHETVIPFRNSVIDMEDVLGYPVYDDRTITVKFWCRVSGDAELKARQSDVANWLLKDTKKRNFKDSNDREYTYSAYCSGVDFNESTPKILKGTATFKAKPFKRRDATGEEVL